MMQKDSLENNQKEYYIANLGIFEYRQKQTYVFKCFYYKNDKRNLCLLQFQPRNKNLAKRQKVNLRKYEKGSNKRKKEE